MTAPLYCDESIWIPVADGLRRRGWEVHTARDERTLGNPDREQLRYAVENDWILLTFDDDFLSLVEGEGLEHAGLIYVQQAGRKIGDVVKTVDAHLDERDEDDRSIQYL
jgi:predicted nuclease of predicted toxin-antitoxin system